MSNRWVGPGEGQGGGGGADHGRGWGWWLRCGGFVPRQGGGCWGLGRAPHEAVGGTASLQGQKAGNAVSAGMAGAVLLWHGASGQP